MVKIIIRLLSFLFLIYTSAQYFDSKKLESNGMIGSYSVIKKKCYKYKRASFIKVNHLNKDYKVEIPFKECDKIMINNNVNLLYSKYFDFFYYPGTIDIKRNLFYFSFGLFLFVLMQWIYEKSSPPRPSL